MQKYHESVLNMTGTPADGVSVLVSLFNGGVATIYSDNGVTEASNPLTTNSLGYFEFYAADGRYTLTISGSGIETINITDVLLEDPQDGSAMVIDGGTISDSAISGGTVTDSALSNITIDGVAVAGSDIAKYSRLNDTDGSSLVGFIQSGTGAVARTGQDKLRETVSVKDFGAVGDGVADDTAAIQAAVNAVLANTNGGTLFIPAGLYKLTSTINFTGSKWFKVYGEGRGTRLFGATGFGYLFTVNTSGNANGSVFEDFMLDQATTGATSGISMSNANVYLLNKLFFRGQDTDVNMSECFATRFVRCVHSNTRGSAIQTTTLAHNTIVDGSNFYAVGITNLKPALNFGDASGNIVVINADFEGCYRDGSFTDVTSLTFDNCYSEFSSQSQLSFVGTCKGVSIQGCRFSDGATFTIANVQGMIFKRNTLKNQVVSIGASVTNLHECDNIVQGTGVINIASVKVNSSATGSAPTVEASDPVSPTARIDYKTQGIAPHYFYINGVLQASFEYTANVTNRASIYGGEEGGYIAFRPIGGTNCSARVSSRGNGEVAIFTNSLTNLVMTFTHVASADNWIQATPGAVGSPVQLVAKGNTDANVGIVVKPKGTTGQAQLQGGSGGVKVGVNDTGLAFYGATPAAKPSITGSRGGNAALTDLLTKLATLGLITDSTSA